MRKEYDFAKLRRAEPKYLKRLKKPVSIRLDPHVIAYFKKLAAKSGLSYQSLINYVLKDYAAHGLEPSACWEHLSSKRKTGKLSTENQDDPTNQPICNPSSKTLRIPLPNYAERRIRFSPVTLGAVSKS